MTPDPQAAVVAEGEHHEDNRKLGEQQPAVASARQRLERPDLAQRADDAGDDKDADRTSSDPRPPREQRCQICCRRRTQYDESQRREPSHPDAHGP